MMRRYTEAEIREMIRDEINITAMYNPKSGPGLPDPFGLVPSDGIWTLKLDQDPTFKELMERMRKEAAERRAKEIDEQNPILNTERALNELRQEARARSEEREMVEVEQQFENQIDLLVSQLMSDEFPEECRAPIRQTLDGIIALLKLAGRPDLVSRIETALIVPCLNDFEKSITEGSEALKGVLDSFKAKPKADALESFKQELVEAKFTDEEIITIIGVIEADRDNIIEISLNVLENAKVSTPITTRWGSTEDAILSGDFFVVEAKTTDGECDTNVFSRYTKACDAKVKLFKLNRERKALMEHI